ncbi:MAG: alpha/beta hydrolase [Anaerolineae bacterium]
MRRYLRLGILGAVVGLGVGGWLAYGDEIRFYAGLLRAYVAAKRFYAEYEHLARDIAFHPEMDPRLDVYSPDSGQDHPVLIFVHGGGWRSYDKELFAPVAQKLVPQGFVVVIPDYTLHPNAGYEQMAHEVAAAISWTLDNVEEYGGDSKRVVVAGHSAGGHLTGLALVDPRFLSSYGHSSTELCGWVGMSGVYDVTAEYEFWQAQGVAAEVMEEVMGGQANFRLASPIHYVQPGLPPVLLIHGEQDDTVPVHIARGFRAALEAVGAENELKVYPGAGHADYLFAALGDKPATVILDLVDFVQRCSSLAP